MDKFSPILEIKEKYKVHLSIIKDMFNHIFKDTSIDSRELAWISQALLEKIYIILSYKGNFNFSSLKYPVNIFPQIRLGYFSFMLLRLKTLIIVTYLFFNLIFNFNAYLFIKTYSKRTNFSRIKLYLVYLEIYKAKRLYKNLKNSETKLKILDQMNFSIEERVKLAKKISFKSLDVSVHGGGYFLYKNLADKFYFEYAKSSFLREDLFFGFYEKYKVLSKKKYSKNKPIIISFAPYFFDANPIEVVGQNVPGIDENLNFIKKLSRSYNDSEIKLIIRDPSKASYRIFQHQSFKDFRKVKFDIGEKNQKKFLSGANWSNNFLKSNIVYSGSFFTLSLQLLFANRPSISLVNSKNLYSPLKAESENLIKVGVFCESLDQMILFDSDEEITNWWANTKKARLSFLKEYLSILNSIGNGLKNYQKVNSKILEIYKI